MQQGPAPPGAGPSFRKLPLAVESGDWTFLFLPPRYGPNLSARAECRRSASFRRSHAAPVTDSLRCLRPCRGDFLRSSSRLLRERGLCGGLRGSSGTRGQGHLLHGTGRSRRLRRAARTRCCRHCGGRDARRRRTWPRRGRPRCQPARRDRKPWRWCSRCRSCRHWHQPAGCHRQSRWRCCRGWRSRRRCRRPWCQSTRCGRQSRSREPDWRRESDRSPLGAQGKPRSPIGGGALPPWTAGRAGGHRQPGSGDVRPELVLFEVPLRVGRWSWLRAGRRQGQWSELTLTATRPASPQELPSVARAAAGVPLYGTCMKDQNCA